MVRSKSLFAAMVSVALLSLFAPAKAATISFSPDEDKSSVIDFCTSSGQNQTCNIAEAEVKFRDGDDRLLDPSATFRFLKFEAKGTDRDKDDDDKKDKKESEGGDTFSVTAKLAFTLGSNPKVHEVMSTGTGSFKTKGGDFTQFSIIWQPIANLFVQGMGVFSFSFEDRNLPKIDDEHVYVKATMTHVSTVPLPAGAWLLLSGLAVLGAARLRRRPAA